ncbi:Rv2175c family DNA-binding protein [Actinomyces minihominis]|uniref:Rv2175c family DNA-binding protein n=1 Tax=Actinomyces minihominis TaxID=2002838 RepID=UPI00101AE06B|nr:Rv2175c family DNA-binding protein [Actinomyces minihominis]
MAETPEEMLKRIPHISVTEAADRIGVEKSRIKQLVNERHILALKSRGERRVLEETLQALPPEDQYVAELRQQGSSEPRLVRVTDEPLATLRGTVLLLEDGGYTNEELVDWLWRDNPWLQARPIDKLREGSHKQVNRVAATESW